MAKANENRKAAAREEASPKRASALVTLPVAGWLLAITATLIFMIAHLWPGSSGDDSPAHAKKLFWAWIMSPETRLLLLVALTGALGAQIHALRSFAFYVGEGRMTRRWTMYYVARPFIGAALALAFYFLVRAWFSPVSVGQPGVYGFVALASLVGLFSESISAKLKRIADALCEKPDA